MSRGRRQREARPRGGWEQVYLAHFEGPREVRRHANGAGGRRRPDWLNELGLVDGNQISSPRYRARISGGAWLEWLRLVIRGRRPNADDDWKHGPGPLPAQSGLRCCCVREAGRPRHAKRLFIPNPSLRACEFSSVSLYRFVVLWSRGRLLFARSCWAAASICSFFSLLSSRAGLAYLSSVGPTLRVVMARRHRVRASVDKATPLSLLIAPSLVYQQIWSWLVPGPTWQAADSPAVNKLKTESFGQMAKFSMYKKRSGIS